MVYTQSAAIICAILVAPRSNITPWLHKWQNAPPNILSQIWRYFFLVIYSFIFRLLIADSGYTHHKIHKSDEAPEGVHLVIHD